MNVNMTGFRWFSIYLCVIVLWLKAASALEGLSFRVHGSDLGKGRVRVTSG